MSLTPKQWKEAKEGFGLEELPKELRRDFQCYMCGTNHPGKLYTDRQIELGYTDGTMKDYKKKSDARDDRLRQNCYCRYHAEQMFGPRDEE